MQPTTLRFGQFLAGGLLLVVLGQPTTAQPNNGLAAAAALQEALISAIARAEVSVVAVVRAPRGPDSNRVLDPDFVAGEYATGVVIDPAGLVLTIRQAPAALMRIVESWPFPE